MEKQTEATLNILKAALWGNEPVTMNPEDAEGVYLLLMKHAIPALPAGMLSNINMPEELRSRWKRQVLEQIYKYMNIVNAQDEVLSALTKEAVPVVVVKGTTAAQYYPNPEYRNMGDIDLLVKKEDFDRAENIVLSCGYSTTNSDHDIDRHISMHKGRTIIELHWRFASEYVIDDPSAFDEILYKDIVQARTTLSTPQNGLVLLEHIAQHLNNGIGLRQIIDWMMYVYRCLDDKLWEQEFRSLSEQTGLEKLAIHVTRMCQLYLGLTEKNISWSKQADEEACESLLDYIINCGNFGKTRKAWDSGEITKIPSPKHPIRLLRYLQERGKKGWTLYKEHPIVGPVAWIYQLNRYIRIAKESKAKGITVKNTYDRGIKRRDMFHKLGITIKNTY